MTWSLRRQLLYVSIFILTISFFAFLIIYPILNKAPTCYDNKQNGNETGVDCGGACRNACIYQVDPLSILWSRAFKVIHGRYNAVAYIENHNRNVVIDRINYKFRFYDKNNIYIGKREGSTYVPPSGSFAIFEPGIDIGNSIPLYTYFDFTEVPKWVTISQEKINQLKVLVSNISLVNEETSPLLTATVKNNSLFTIPEVDIIVLLYDLNGNAVSVSRTYLEELRGEEVKDISFTWPEPFSSKVIEKEIIPMYNINGAELK